MRAKSDEFRKEKMGSQELIAKLEQNIGSVYLGRRDRVRLLTTALIAGGHALIEDVPGVGKTVLAKALALSIDCAFRRIQFTPDLLPSDVTGVSVFNQQTGDFNFKRGPIFANVILADEINRTTPRTQSCLLEAMNDFQVTVDGVSHKLEPPFIVIATQNPFEFEGTYPLPENQLDRFMLRISLGYPGREEEKQVFRAQKLEHPIETLKPVMSTSDALALQGEARRVTVSESILDYLMAVVERTRSHPDLFVGASPRGGISLLRAAQAFALCEGRDYVLPDDVKLLAAPVLSHRIICRNRPVSESNSAEASRIIAGILELTPVPM